MCPKGCLNHNKKHITCNPYNDNKRYNRKHIYQSNRFYLYLFCIVLKFVIRCRLIHILVSISSKKLLWSSTY